jgi:hypothetical protein
MVTIMGDIFGDELDQFGHNGINHMPVTLLSLFHHEVSDVANLVPVFLAHIFEFASSLKVEDFVFKLISMVNSLSSLVEEDVLDKEIEGLFHSEFSVTALFWSWSWALMTIILGVLKGLHHEPESSIGGIPVTVLGSVQHPSGSMIEMVEVSFALAFKMTGFLEGWSEFHEILESFFSLLLVFSLDGLTHFLEVFFHSHGVFLALVLWAWTMTMTVSMGLLEGLHDVLEVSFRLVPVTGFGSVEHSLGETIDNPHVLGTLTLEFTSLLEAWNGLDHEFQFGFNSFLVMSLDTVGKFL